MARFICSISILVSLVGCDRRVEIPTAASAEACTAVDLGDAESLPSKMPLPVDRVVTFEGMPHHMFFGWTQDGKSRAVSKLLGTERKVLLFQEFDGETPPSTTTLTGVLRRWSDLPANPWDEVRTGMKTRYGWEIPADSYVLMEGFRPEGCPAR